MESFITQWNTLSEFARQIIIVCVATEVIIWVLMISLLKAYDIRAKTWTMDVDIEDE